MKTDALVNKKSRGVEVITITKGGTLGLPYRPLAKLPPDIKGDSREELPRKAPEYDRRRNNRGWKDISSL